MFITAEINELQTLVTGMDEELKAGNISLKDNIRIKALLFSLQNELDKCRCTINSPAKRSKIIVKKH